MSTQFDYSVQVYSPFMTCWPPLLPPQPKTHIPLETLIKQKGFTCFQNSTERKRVMVSSRGLLVGDGLTPLFPPQSAAVRPHRSIPDSNRIPLIHHRAINSPPNPPDKPECPYAKVFHWIENDAFVWNNKLKQPLQSVFILFVHKLKSRSPSIFHIMSSAY